MLVELSKRMGLFVHSVWPTFVATNDDELLVVVIVLVKWIRLLFELELLRLIKRIESLV